MSVIIYVSIPVIIRTTHTMYPDAVGTNHPVESWKSSAFQNGREIASGERSFKSRAQAEARAKRAARDWARTNRDYAQREVAN